MPHEDTCRRSSPSIYCSACGHRKVVISHHVWWIIIDLRLVSPGCVLFLARALDMWGGEGYQYLWIGSALVEYSVCLADVIHEERFSPSWWSFVGIKTGTLLRINNTHMFVVWNTDSRGTTIPEVYHPIIGNDRSVCTCDDAHRVFHCMGSNGQ